MDIGTPEMPRVIAVPSDRAWFDPRLLVNNSQVLTYNLTIDASGTGMILPYNANRYMLLLSGGIIGTASYAPWPEVSAYAAFGPFNPGATLTRVSLFDIGPIITQAWYVLGSGFDTIHVVETQRV